MHHGWDEALIGVGSIRQDRREQLALLQDCGHEGEDVGGGEGRGEGGAHGLPVRAVRQGHGMPAENSLEEVCYTGVLARLSHLCSDLGGRDDELSVIANGEGIKVEQALVRQTEFIAQVTECNIGMSVLWVPTDSSNQRREMAEE